MQLFVGISTKQKEMLVSQKRKRRSPSRKGVELMWKEFGKWLIERDADAGATVLGGKIDSVKLFYATVVGVTQGIHAGTAIFVAVYGLKWLAGYLDLRLRITEYRNNYISAKVPMNVRILKNPRLRGSKTTS